MPFSFLCHFTAGSISLLPSKIHWVGEVFCFQHLACRSIAPEPPVSCCLYPANPPPPHPRLCSVCSCHYFWDSFAKWSPVSKSSGECVCAPAGRPGWGRGRAPSMPVLFVVFTKLLSTSFAWHLPNSDWPRLADLENHFQCYAQISFVFMYLNKYL